MGLYEDMMQKIAEDTMNWRGRVPGFGAAPAPAASVVAPGMEVGPVSPQAGAYQSGRNAANWLRSSKWLPSMLRRVPGVGVAAEGALGSDTTPMANALRMGVGAGALVNPAIGGPLALGMGTASLVGDVADATFKPGQSSILNPQFAKDVDAAGGVSAYIKGLGPKLTGAVPGAPLTENTGDVRIGGVTYSADALKAMTEPSRFGSIPGANPAPVAARNYGARPTAEWQPTGNPAGDFMGALIGMKQISGDNTVRIAQAKQTTENIKAGSHIGLEAMQGAHAGAQAQDLLMRQQLAQVARVRGAPESEVAGILAGRPVSQERFSVPVGLGGMKPTDPSTVLNTRTGALTVTRPLQVASKADFDADVKRLGSKTLVLQEYARRNITPPKE